MNTRATSSCMYVTYIRSTLDKVWTALIEPEFTTQYWFGIHHETNWQVDAEWKMVFDDGDIAASGSVLQFNPPRRLVLSWQHEYENSRGLKDEGRSRCEIDLEMLDGAVKVSIFHSIERPESKLIAAVADGWPKVMANLKSLLETGNLAFLPST